MMDLEIICEDDVVETVQQVGCCCYFFIVIAGVYIFLLGAKI